MIVRLATAADHPAYAAMRARLWPDQDAAELERELSDVLDPPQLGFLAEDTGALIGFIEIWVRSYAEGCPPSPTAYVEGLWVEPEHRRRGVARALLRAAEGWAREQGYGHIGSDALLDNAASHAWHRAVGFAEVERVVAFAKPLAPQNSRK